MNSANEIQAATAFSKQSVVFDKIYANDAIVQYKRTRVRAHLQQLLKPESHILELNAGTGEDALYLAREGHKVHATDISTGMQEQLRQKADKAGLSQQITQEVCSYTRLEQLIHKGPYDHIFSNFAGLNCTDELDKVLSSLTTLLKPGGSITLVILPRFCIWEFLLLFKGKWKTALRRFSGRKGARSHIEGTYFRCWYYAPSYVIKHLSPGFQLLALEGLCTFVPPSYMEGFAGKHPVCYRWLQRLENRLRFSWPWRLIGDYYIISLRKN